MKLRCECGAEYVMERDPFRFRCFVCRTRIVDPETDEVESVELAVYI